MKKLLTIIGARPQIIKAAALSRAIKNKYASQFKEIIVHTGQHYDHQMSDVFFDELQIPRPDYNLQVGSGKHGEQTAKMIIGLEKLIESEQPDFLIIYGDTNSTLAGAIAAAKLHTPIVHIEAGLRSFNKRMPEEINRILSDHVSTYLFPPTMTGYANLVKEGFSEATNQPFTMDNPGVFMVGDVMYDNSVYCSALAENKSDILERLSLEPNNFILATIHRNANTDDSDRLNTIFETLHQITTTHSVRLVLPVHPRTVKQMAELLNPEMYKAIQGNPNMLLIPPVSFLEMIRLEQQAKLVITDSGGVQKEAFFFRKPCIILRAETEWLEIVESGAAILCDADKSRILNAYTYFTEADRSNFTPLYGDGNAAESILDILLTSSN